VHGGSKVPLFVVESKCPNAMKFSHQVLQKSLMEVARFWWLRAPVTAYVHQNHASRICLQLACLLTPWIKSWTEKQITYLKLWFCKLVQQTHRLNGHTASPHKI
jgi:hypothetical protein